MWKCTFLMLTLPFIATADDKPKADPPKPPAKRSEKDPTITDPAKAGPDFAFQGEYVISQGEKKIGAQVIAGSEGQFTVRFLKDGLPGDGWDGKNQQQHKGSLDKGKVSVESKQGTINIENGKITLTAPGETLMGEKVTRKSPTEGMKPPVEAVVLFDGTNLDQWTKPDGKTAPTWVVENGVMRVKGGDVLSKPKFAGPQTIHVEFMLPFMPRARGQSRANSGVYIQNRYELQVLDSFGLAGKNNEAGGFYQAHDPKVNMCFPPLQWQTYDIDFTPAKWEAGKKVANARATVKHNGVLVQDDVELKGPSGGGAKEDESGGGIRLQDHGDPLMFRNIWVVEKKP